MSDQVVLHVSEVSWGGVVSLLEQFTQAQLDEGMTVHVLSPELGELPGGVLRHPWHVDRHRPQSLLSAVRTLRRVVAEVRPDVIHLHSFMAGWLGRLPGVLGGAGHRPAVVYQPHAWSFDLYPDAVRPRLVRAAERSGRKRTDVLVTNCQDEIDEATRNGISLPAHVLGVAVDLDRFHPVEDEVRDRLRTELGLPDGRLCVSVGRIAYQKGQDLLVPAWEAGRPPGAHLVLVGPGDVTPLKEAAPREWGRSIHWVGEQSDVRPWVWAADLTLLPSRYETVAVVVAESLAAGRPVVATAVNGAAEAIVAPPGEPAGAVVPLGDMQTLLTEAGRRLEDPGLRAAESAAGRRRASTRFTLAGVASNLRTAYADATEKSRTRGGHR